MEKPSRYLINTQHFSHGDNIRIKDIDDEEHFPLRINMRRIRLSLEVFTAGGEFCRVSPGPEFFIGERVYLCPGSLRLYCLEGICVDGSYGTIFRLRGHFLNGEVFEKFSKYPTTYVFVGKNE